MSKVAFINPFGTPAYNGLIEETLHAYARPGTEIAVSNVTNCPENIDYYYTKHIVELEVFEHVIKAEKDGFDAVIVGCCYDPGVRTARELVDIPVIGPLEATMQMASYFGHDYAVVTDHHKAVPLMRDLIRLYGDANCRGVGSINWWITDMIKDSAGVARDALAAAEKARSEHGVEAVILACTIISASVEKTILAGGIERDPVILNPNTMALKMAESLADLHAMGAYGISRRGYYDKMSNHAPDEFEAVREQYGNILSKLAATKVGQA